MAAMQKKGPVRVGRFLCSLLTGVLAAALCGCQEKSAASTKNSKPLEKGPTKNVQVIVAAKQPIERTVTVLGSLKAKQEVILRAKVGGRVEGINVDIGSRVTGGQVLARIDPRDYELRIQQAEGALAQTRARLGLPLQGAEDMVDPEKVSSVKEAKAVFEEARLARERAQNLDRAQLIPKSELDAAEAAYKVALNRYETALDEARWRQAALAERRAELNFARQQLADTTITAPFDGVIQVRHANLGAYLKDGDSVVTLVQMDPLRLHLEVPEPEAPRVTAGQEVRFTITGETTERKSTISRVSPALEKEARILVVEADVANDGSLHAGAFAQAQIVVQGESRAVIVPPEAIRTFAGVQKIYAFEDGRAIEKEITTGARGPGWVEVLTGLKEGDRVVLAPAGLRSGDAVAVVDSKEPSS